jgi:hypothetical protein
MMTPQTYKRFCPKCGQPVIHVNEDSFKHSVAIKSVCRSCRHLDRKQTEPACCHNSVKRTEEARIRFIQKMEGINPHLEVFYVNSQKAGGRCSKHNVEFTNTPANLLAGYGCQQCLNERRQAQRDAIKAKESPNTELEEQIGVVLIRKHGLTITEADGYNRLLRHIRGKILQSTRQTGQKPTQQMVCDRVAEMNVTEFLGDNRANFIEEQREALREEAKQRAIVHDALREQADHPGSTLCHIESGNDKIYYLKFDGRFKLIGDPESYRTIQEVNAQLRHVEAPPLAVEGLNITKAESPPSTSSLLARRPPTVPLPEIIEKYRTRLDALDIAIPEEGHQVFMYTLKMSRGQAAHIFFMLDYYYNGYEGVYVYCYRRTFGSPDELFDYLETLDKETYEKDSTVATPTGAAD